MFIKEWHESCRCYLCDQFYQNCIVAADDMGLGKTLTSISLILKDKQIGYAKKGLSYSVLVLTW